MRSRLIGLLLLMALALVVAAACDGSDGEKAAEGEMTASRLATVQERGTLICASRNDVPGYGSLDASGRNVGFDIDLCRAVAAAVLGDAEAIQITLINGG